MKLARLFMFLLPAFVLGMVPACKKESGKPKIAIVTNNPELFWVYCEAGAREAAQQNDVELIFRRPEKGDVSVQMDIVNALENQGVAGMAVSVLDPQNQAGALKILSGKLKLLTMDNDAPGSDRICYVGTDNYAAGRMVGKLVAEVMPQGGDLAIFVGEAAPLNACQRFWGVIDELEGREIRKDFPAPKYGESRRKIRPLSERSGHRQFEPRNLQGQSHHGAVADRRSSKYLHGRIMGLQSARDSRSDGRQILARQSGRL